MVHLETRFRHGCADGMLSVWGGGKRPCCLNTALVRGGGTYMYICGRKFLGGMKSKYYYGPSEIFCRN